MCVRACVQLNFRPNVCCYTFKTKCQTAFELCSKSNGGWFPYTFRLINRTICMCRILTITSFKFMSNGIPTANFFFSGLTLSRPFVRHTSAVCPKTTSQSRLAARQNYLKADSIDFTQGINSAQRYESTRTHTPYENQLSWHFFLCV